jgi:hypothetical protein
MTTTPDPDDVPAPVYRMRRRRACIRIGATLAPLSRATRRRIYAAMNASRHRRGRLDDQRRGLLLDAIIRVADDQDRRHPDHPQVCILDAIQRRLERDLDGEMADAA